MAATANRRKKADAAPPGAATDDLALPADGGAVVANAARPSGPERPAGRAVRTPRQPPRATPRAAPAASALAPGAMPMPGAAPSAASTSPVAQLIELGAAAATVRRALFNEWLEDALEMMVQVAADVLAPAVAEVWLAEQAPGMAELGRTGGQQVAPVLRRRAAAGRATSTGQWPLATLGALADDTAREAGPPSVPLAPAAPEGLVREVAGTRRALVLREAASDPLARAWLAQTDAPGLDMQALAAYPLLVRGQLLGVFVLGTARALGPHHLATLEAAADGCAMAVERDHLLQYSQTQEALAQTVVRQAPVAVCVLRGPDHVFELANPAFTQLLGVEGSIEGRHLEDVIVGVERLSETLRLDAVYATGVAQAMVELPVHVGRGLTYWNVTISPLLLGRGGRVRGVLVAAVDMTHAVRERGQAVADARAARARVEQMTALHNISLALAGQLGADPRELLANILRSSIELLGARAGVVYLMDPDGALEVTVAHGLHGNYVGQRVAPGEGLAGQVALAGRGTHLDDSRLFAMRPALYADEGVTAMIAVPLVRQQRVVGVLEVLDDADERTFTEEDVSLLGLFAAQAAQGVENAHTYVELERAYQAQRELDRMKDDFIATASHELRTPLTGVRGYLDLLLDFPGSRDDPLAVEFLSRAAESAAELDELTTRLLHTARLESGQIETRSETLGARELADLIDQVIQRQRAAVPAADAADSAPGAPGAGASHRFVVALAPDLRVRADRRQLREVLANLVSNAVKYSPDGGAVRIAGRVADVTPDPADGPVAAAGPSAPPARGFALLTDSDTGVGIAPGERAQLFGRFARLDAARASQIRGTGLGLYICRQLMEAMDGTIWLEASAPGQGSTFALALPLAAEGVDGMSRVDPSGPPGGPSVLA